MQLESSAFKEGELIPLKYTCDGIDVSPPLSWKEVPKETKSLALICEDPDAPRGTWIHWIVYNIPPHLNGLPENQPHDDELPNGSLQGLNDFRKIGYGGPCPPSGTHRYFFILYALDTEIALGPGATKKQLLKAMDGHILEKTELMGKYSRR